MTDKAKLESAAAQDVAKTAIHQVLGEDSSVPAPAADHYEDINSKAQRLEYEIEKIEKELAAANARIELLEHDAKSGNYETLYAQTVMELQTARSQLAEAINDREQFQLAVDEMRQRYEAAEARLAEVERHSYAAFFNEVCARAERAMLTSHKLEGMHFLAMKQVKAEWDAAIDAARRTEK